MGDGYYSVALRIPLKDVDEFRVVWYGNYLAYFDVARTELLRKAGLSPSDQASYGFYAPVVSTCIKYHYPARNDDEIIVDVRPELEKIARIRFLFRIRRKKDGRLLVTGETAHVVKTTDGVLLYRIPEVIVERMKAIINDLRDEKDKGRE